MLDIKEHITPGILLNETHFPYLEMADVMAGAVETVCAQGFYGAIDIAPVSDAWRVVFETDICFGHAIWAGSLSGVSCVVVGSRGGSKELNLLRPLLKDLSRMDRVLLDQGVGATQVSVVGNRLLSANHATGEVALYEINF